MPAALSRSRRSGAEQSSMCCRGSERRAGPAAGTAPAGTAPWNRPAIHVCRPPWHRPGARQGWQPILHCAGSPGTSVPVRLSDTRVHGVSVPAQLSAMSSLGQGCSDAAGVPRGSWHGLCHGHSSQPSLFPPSPAHSRCTDEKSRAEETRSTKLCLLAAAAKIVLHLRENWHLTLFTVPSPRFSPQPKCPSFPLPNTFFS